MTKLGYRKPRQTDIERCVGKVAAKRFAVLLTSGPCWTIVDDRVVVAVVGVSCPWAGTGEAWAIAGPDIAKYLAAPRLIRELLQHEVHSGAFRRIQSMIDSTNHTNIRFAEYMGFRKESTLKRYGPAGQDYSVMTLEIP